MEIRRDIIDTFLQWKDQASRKPILLKVAWQRMQFYNPWCHRCRMMCHIIGRPIAEQKLSLSFSREKILSRLKSKPSNVLVGGVCLYIRKNTNLNTAFASLSSICNTIMGYLVVHLPLQNGLNGSCPKNELERPKHLFVRVEKFNETIASCSTRYVMQWAQLIYLCKVSIRATESKSRRIMSAVGTTL